MMQNRASITAIVRLPGEHCSTHLRATQGLTPMTITVLPSTMNKQTTKSYMVIGNKSSMKLMSFVKRFSILGQEGQRNESRAASK